MRIVQYVKAETFGCGVEREGRIYPTGYADTRALIADGRRGLAVAEAAVLESEPISVDRLTAPLTNPGKIIGAGVNYASHGIEAPGYVFADECRWDFIKVASAIIGPGEPIVIPPNDDVIRRVSGDKSGPLRDHGFAVDYEVELAVIIGARARNVRAEDAHDHIFGYTVINDVGSRSVQFHNAQLDLGKNFDTFCPIGPCIVTADELPDWQQIRIRSFVNGELRQDALAGEQICKPNAAIEWLSSVMTLEPGDVLSTGTPAGCATFMDPPRFLNPGDIVTVSATGIGELTNPVVAGVTRTTSRA